MKTKASNEPPGSRDLEGWRSAIAGHRLASFRLEAIAAAFQELGDADQGVRLALAKHLNDAVLGMLRKFIRTNHPNEGWDMIYRAHTEIFAALLQSGSADGRALNVHERLEQATLPNHHAAVLLVFVVVFCCATRIVSPTQSFHDIR
jgi:hypothetical protein